MIDINWKPAKNKCRCGGNPEPHDIGSELCHRKYATGSLIPRNFRYVGSEYGFNSGTLICDVGKGWVTEYTLFNQRLYAKHEDGRWSLPKSEESINSISMD